MDIACKEREKKSPYSTHKCSRKPVHSDKVQRIMTEKHFSKKKTIKALKFQIRNVKNAIIKYEFAFFELSNVNEN